MKIIKEIFDNEKFEKYVVAIGNFDGVHLGHKALIEKVKHISQKNKIKSAVFTFYNHPVVFINKIKKYYITCPEEKIKILSDYGIDTIICPYFDEKFMNMTHEKFANWLEKKLSPFKIVVGENFNFGYLRKGDAKYLKTRFKDKVVVVSSVKKNGMIVSSTKIREFLNNGNIEKANEFLGYSYFVEGNVVEGKKIGRNIDCPTLNLDFKESIKIIPKKGIYITKTYVDGKEYESVTNIGGAPTLDFENDYLIENNIFDKHFENMYNKKIKISFFKYIRDLIKFKDLNELKKAIKKDIEIAKNYFKRG